MKIREEYTCPLELTHDLTKGKWKPILLWKLKEGPMALSTLEREIKGISQKMLLEQLKELTKGTLVEKKSYEGYPLRVEYFLTARGERLLAALTIMQQVGIEMMLEAGMEETLEETGLYPQKSV